MDSFKDKIAEKFGTTDMIRANFEAEARELNNAKAKIEDLEKAVSEMRRLSLKCAETNELTTQIVQAAIEKIEETSVVAGASADYSAEFAGIKAELDSLKENLETLFKDQEEIIHKEDVRVYRNVQAALIDELKQQSEAIALQHKHIEGRVGGIKPIAIISLVFSGHSLATVITMFIMMLINVI